MNPKVLKINQIPVNSQFLKILERGVSSFVDLGSLLSLHYCVLHVNYNLCFVTSIIYTRDFNSTRIIFCAIGYLEALQIHL